MALSKVSLCYFLVLLTTCCIAQNDLFSSDRRLGTSRNRCNIDKITAQQATRKVESQMGTTEFFSQRNAVFDCVGVTVQRRVIQPKGLFLPSYINSPRLIYIVQGSGFSGTVVPGCPESFQSFQQSEDQHQRVNQFREGDVLAVPAGVSHWAYNNGNKPIIAVTLVDHSNTANQLDQNPKQFMLAGRKQKSREQHSFEDFQESGNILDGFNSESLAETMGISRELVEKLKGRNDNRGEIVRVEEEFRVVKPSRREEYGSKAENGLEQAFCSLSIKENIDDEERADIYNPNAGRVTLLNGQKLPILKQLNLNIEKGVVKKNAMFSPHWNVNAHAIVYIIQGRARVEIVNQNGKNVHENEVRKGQVVVVPQSFATLIKASEEGFEYISFFTNDNAMVSNIVGKDSILKGMPIEVIMNAYRVSREEAWRLKNNRGQEIALFEPRSQG